MVATTTMKENAKNKENMADIKGKVGQTIGKSANVKILSTQNNVGAGLFKLQHTTIPENKRYVNSLAEQKIGSNGSNDYVGDGGNSNTPKTAFALGMSSLSRAKQRALFP